MGIGVSRYNAKNGIAYNFRTITCQIGCFIKTSIYNAFVQFFVCLRMACLYLEREVRRWRKEGGNSWGCGLSRKTVFIDQ